jgi:glycosyltransferase involved in cell wall biosynthesis
MKKLKILIVTADYPPPMGGIQVFTYELEQELLRAGHKVKILNFDGRNLNTYKYLNIRDFFYTEATRNSYYSLRKILNPRNFLKISGGYRDFVYKNMLYRVTRKEIKDFKPDLVHVMKNELYSAVYNISVPYVVSCHSSNVDIFDAEHIRYSLNHAARIHCVSNFTKGLVQEIVQRDDKDISVIYNFIDLDIYKNNTKHKKDRIITVSRITKRKNIHSIIKAFALLPNQIRNKFEYYIVGGGPEIEKLKFLSKKLNLNNIVFTGEITNEEEKIKLLSRSKLFILCPAVVYGESETFGIVYIEAQALQIPVIASKIGGIPESVGNGGIYIENETDPNEIAKKIELVLTDKNLYNRLVMECEERIYKFDKKLWFNKILKMYDEIIKTN